MGAYTHPFKELIGRIMNYRVAHSIESSRFKPAFDRTREYTFGDDLRKTRFVGDERYAKMKKSLKHILVEHEYKTERVNKLAERTYNVLRAASKETPYNFTVDGVALNVTSLPFILTDLWAARAAENPLHVALNTRKTAFLPNFITGRIFGSYQDRISDWLDRKYTIKDEPKRWKRGMKKWSADAFIFLTGQTWLYAGYLTAASWLSGEQPDPGKIAQGAALLTMTAPLIGPAMHKGYKVIREHAGLPPEPAWMKKHKNTQELNEHGGVS